MKNHIYVGITLESGNRRVFTCSHAPTELSHGQLYAATIGPFRTMRGARFMAEHGRNNPHLQTVADAERITLQYQGQTELCNAHSAHLISELQAMRRKGQ